MRIGIDDLENLVQVTDKVTLQVHGKSVTVLPDDIKLGLQDDVSFVQMMNPRENPPFNNWSVN